MIQNLPIRLRALASRTALAAVLGAVAAAPLPAMAQSAHRDRPPADTDVGNGGKGQKKAEPQAPKGPPGSAAPTPAPATEAVKPRAPRLPQTADEKAKALADLYARLQTAEDEESAKKVAQSIERLWSLSGSDTVSLLLQRSAKAQAEKNMDLALKLLDAAIDLAPDHAEAFNQRAYFHFSNNNYDGAVGDLRRVLALDPNHYRALEGLAQIWRETGNKKGAYKVMQQLLEVHPFAPGAKEIHDTLKKEVDGQGI